MQIRIAVALGVLLVASACTVVEPPPPPAAPRIGSLTASKARIAPGEQVTLSFTTTGATRLELADDTGSKVDLEGPLDSGTATVSPTRTAFYVLRATGPGGRDTAFVQIAVNEPLRDLFLVAVPNGIDSGDEAQLLWGAPGAATVTLTTGSGSPAPLVGTTGTLTVTPAATEQYTLTAQGAPGSPPLTAQRQLTVRPVLKSATLTLPASVQPGQTLSFLWTTAGATTVTVAEQTFGPLTSVSDAASVASGSFDFVIPATLPNGVGVSDGLPLRFVVTATAGTVSVSRPLTAVVGDLPVIERVDAPEFASSARNFDVSWKTLNASKVTITVGGLPVFQTLPGNQARVDQGSVSLPVPTTQTEYVLVAANARGATAQRIFNVRPVALPVINSYTLTPSVSALGDPATARWTTTNATRLQLRFENGATLAVVTTPSQIASGSVVLTPASSARVVLEAFNPAGDMVSDVKAIAFTGGAVSVTPTPVLRGAPATLSWTLSPAAVQETVGLPTPAGAPVPSSPNFIDLTTVAGAQELTFADPTEGAERLVPPEGIRFPLLGRVRPALYVSVNGFIAFADPGGLATNLDLTAMASPAPSMIAPLWDDLSLAMTSKVLYARQTASSGERSLVVQWDKVQLAADTASELTFQVHLYETGQVTFVYKTLVGSLNSVTVGVRDTEWPATQQFTFDSMTTVPSNDLELNWFTGGPVDGTLPLTASRSRRIEFFGRTATGLVPASTELRSFGAGDVKVSEAMPFPEATVSTTGQWVELMNAADLAVDFEGLWVDSTGSSVDGGYVIPAGTVVPAGGYLVLGQSTNPVDTGGAPVDQVATDLPLAAVDRVRVQLDGTVLSQLAWDAGVPGTSIMAGGSLLVAAGQTFACSRTRTFGTAGALGTPGAANESCSPYVLTSIAGGFVPAPAGSEILASIDGDEGYADVTLPVPFTYFGVQRTTFSLSTNGFITFGAPLSDAHYSNNTSVNTTQPNGVVAVFWDDLDRDAGKIAMWRQADRTIISYQDFTPFFVSATTLNMQIHLRDDGVIEFHYGNLSTTSTDPFDIDQVGGRYATVWLERHDGVIAVPSSVNQLNSVAPNSGLRFTPVP